MTYLTLPVAYSVLFAMLTAFLFAAIFVHSGGKGKRKEGEGNQEGNTNLDGGIDRKKNKQNQWFYIQRYSLSYICKNLKDKFLNNDAVFNPTSEFVHSEKKLNCSTLALSIYASSVGNWVLYIPPAVGAFYSWLGVVGYTLGCVGTQLTLMFFLPYVGKFTNAGHSGRVDDIIKEERKEDDDMQCENNGEKVDFSRKEDDADIEEEIRSERDGRNSKYNNSNSPNNNSKSANKVLFIGCDYILYRHGNIAHILVCLNSLLLMWITITAELTTIVYTMQLLTNYKMNTLAIVMSVSLFTLLYTTYGGLEASILTDKIQGVMIVILCIIVVCSISIHHGNNPNTWSKASFVDNRSLIVCFVFFLSIFPCEQFNQGTWQRVLSAKNEKDAKVSLIMSSTLIAVTVFTLGVIGIFANALYLQEDGSIHSSQTNPMNCAIFNLLLPLHEVILCIAAILALCLVCSSVDTQQNAISALIANKLLQAKLSMNWARLFSMLLNIPAIIVASLQYDILKLFMLSNLLCSSMVMPQLLSPLFFVTHVGFICGCVGGIFTIFVCGWTCTQDFVKGIQFIFPDNISSMPYLYAFLLTPVMSGIVTVIFSFLDIQFIHKGKRNKINESFTSLEAKETAERIADRNVVVSVINEQAEKQLFV